MARERSPQRDEAMKMWLDSGGKMKLKDIAAALGLGETQIRKWKSVDRWSDALNSNVTNAPISNVTKGRGAPKGNKNAVGNRGGAPKGNQNAKGNRGGNGGPYRNKKALKHGMYETIFMDALEPDEQELLNHIDTTPLVQLEEQLRLLTLQERRHMKRVKLLEEGLSDEERKVKEELMQRKDMVPYVSPKSGKQIQVPVQTEGLKVTEITTVVTSKLDKILKQEEALVKTRDKKIRVINLIANMKQEEEKLKIARERLELDKFKVLGRDDDEGDGDDEDGDEDDLGW